MDEISTGQRILLRIVATAAILITLWALGFVRFGGLAVVS